MSRPVIITCAVTGSAALSAKNRVPVTPEEIAGSALDAWRAGAAIVHLHVRDPATGAPSGELRLYEDVVERIRRSGSDVLINLTTGYGGRLIPGRDDPRRPGPGSMLITAAQRCAHIGALRPELCSLDMGSLNFGDTVFINAAEDLREMAGLIGAAGVVPELEIFEPGHLRLARDFIARGLLPDPAYFQLCLGVAWGSPADSRTMQYLVDLLPRGARWSAFGIGGHQIPMAGQAVLLGGQVRVGLEDNLYVAKGVPATNPALVERAVAIVEALGDRPASTAEARAMLLPGAA